MLLEQHAVEGDLVEAIENVARGARRAVPMHRIDLNENRVLGGAFAHQRGDGGIAGIAAVPIRLAVDLDGLKHGRQARRGEQDVRRDGVVAKHVAAAGMHIGGGDE